MEATLQEGEQVQKHFRLITSVVGIGMVTAIAFLICTQDFTAFNKGGPSNRRAVVTNNLN